MTQQIERFVIADPRSYDGDPYEVAARAVLQAAALARLFQKTLVGARLMARNADLERQLALTGECNVDAFDQAIQAQKLDELHAQAATAEKILALLAKAVAYNPNAKIGR